MTRCVNPARVKSRQSKVRGRCLRHVTSSKQNKIFDGGKHTQLSLYLSFILSLLQKSSTPTMISVAARLVGPPISCVRRSSLAPSLSSLRCMSSIPTTMKVRCLQMSSLVGCKYLIRRNANAPRRRRRRGGTFISSFSGYMQRVHTCDRGPPNPPSKSIVR
jgi:hypothetical protein